MPTRRSLVIADHREELRAAADALVEADGEDFVGVHSHLVSRKMRSLNREEQKDLERRRRQWVEHGPPPQARRELVF